MYSNAKGYVRTRMYIYSAVITHFTQILLYIESVICFYGEIGLLCICTNMMEYTQVTGHQLFMANAFGFCPTYYWEMQDKEELR